MWWSFTWMAGATPGTTPILLLMFTFLTGTTSVMIQSLIGEDYPEDIKTLIQKHNPELYASVLETYEDARAEADEERRSIPFHDVPDPDKRGGHA